MRSLWIARGGALLHLVLLHLPWRGPELGAPPSPKTTKSRSCTAALAFVLEFDKTKHSKKYVRSRQRKRNKKNNGRERRKKKKDKRWKRADGLFARDRPLQRGSERQRSLPDFQDNEDEEGLIVVDGRRIAHEEVQEDRPFRNEDDGDVAQHAEEDEDAVRNEDDGDVAQHAEEDEDTVRNENGADVDAENQKDDGDVAQHDEADEDTVRNEDDGDVAQDKEADEGEVQEQEIVDLVVDAPVFYKEGLQERLVPEIHEQQTEQDLQAQRVVPEIQDINMIGEYEDEQKNQGPPRELMEEVELQPQDDDDKVEDDVDEEKVMFYDLEDELDNYGKNAGDKDSATAVFSLPGSRKNTQEEVREQEEYDHEDEEDVAAQRPSRNPHVPEQQLYDEDATTSAQSATPSSARFRLEQEHGNASPPTSSRAANLSPEESNDEDGNASAEEGSSQRLEDAVSLHLDDDTDNEEEFVARANEQRRYAQSSREAIKEDDGENDDQSDTDIDEDSDASQLADSDSSRLLFQKNIPRSQCQTSANIILEDKRCTSDIKIGEKKWRWKPALSALKNKCRGLCRDKTLCKSFAVRQNLGRCYLYKSKMTAATIDNHCTLSWPTGKIYNLICPTTSTTTSTTTPGPVPATTSSSTAPSTTSSSTAPSTTSSTTAPSTTSSSTTAPSTTRSSSTTAPSTTSSSTALPTTTASTSTTDPITPLFATLTATTTITSTSTTTTTLPPLDLNTCEASPAAGNTITRGAGATCEDGEYQDATDPVETESEKTVDDYGIIAERDDCLRKCKLRVEALGDEGACRSFGVLGEFCRLYAMPFDEASCVPNWGTEGNNALIYDMVCQRQKSGGFSVVIGGESR